MHKWHGNNIQLHRLEGELTQENFKIQIFQLKCHNQNLPFLPLFFVNLSFLETSSNQFFFEVSPILFKLLLIKTIVLIFNLIDILNLSFNLHFYF